MPSNFQARLDKDIKAALKAGEKSKLRALRLILAGVRQHQVDQRCELDETAEIALLGKMAKQCRESIDLFDAAGRVDLAANERFELSLITGYLPTPLSEAEVEEYIERALSATDAKGVQDLGKVMGQLKPMLQGRADMGAVSTSVKKRLSPENQ